jgi:hypothetical protein
MNAVRKNLVGTEFFVFIDDVITFSKSAQEHAEELENVLQRFDKANLQLQPGKYVFAQPQVQYLGSCYLIRGFQPLQIRIKLWENTLSRRTSRMFRHF